jgi:hypothetical protein
MLKDDWDKGRKFMEGAVAEVLLFIVVVIKLIQELFDVKIHSTVVLLYICE